MKNSIINSRTVSKYFTPPNATGIFLSTIFDLSASAASTNTTASTSQPSNDVGQTHPPSPQPSSSPEVSLQNSGPFSELPVNVSRSIVEIVQEYLHTVNKTNLITNDVAGTISGNIVGASKHPETVSMLETLLSSGTSMPDLINDKNNIEFGGTILQTSEIQNDTEIVTTIFLEPDLRVHHPTLAILLGMICVIVVFGNVLTMLSIYRERYLHTVTNYFIASLAAADCLVGAIVMPFSVVHEVMNKWWIFGQDWSVLIILSFYHQSYFTSKFNLFIFFNTHPRIDEIYFISYFLFFLLYILTYNLFNNFYSLFYFP